MESTTRSITVNAPLRIVYNQWTQFEDFPRFMEGIRSVQQIDDTTLRWTADVAGKTATWTAQITEQVPDRLVEWQSISGRTNNGRVQFASNASDQTVITVRMDYESEGVIENAGDALGLVARRIDGDLERFKDFIEGRGRATGAWRGEVHAGRETSDTSSS